MSPLNLEEEPFMTLAEALLIKAVICHKVILERKSIENTAFAVKVSKNLILEYVNIMEDFKKQDGDIDRDVPDPYPIR